MATNITLSQKEKAVYLAVVEQSKKYPDEPFIYSVKEGQLFLNDSGMTIDRSEHIEIIRNLALKKVIDADWLIADDVDAPFCDFALNKDWAKEKFAMATLSSYNENIFFINIHPSEIKSVKETFTMACIANISIAPDPLALEICCRKKNGEEEKLVVHAFKDESRPYQIVTYAISQSDRSSPIFRNELSKKIRGENNRELIKPSDNIRKIFGRSPIITETLSPLIELKADHIRVKKDVKLTQSQYRLIKQAANNS